MSIPVFTLFSLIKDYQTKTDLKLFKGLIKHIHIEETIFFLDFSDYSHFDRDIFGLWVVEFGMSLIVILFVELTKNSQWQVASYYKTTHQNTYLYSLGVL